MPSASLEPPALDRDAVDSLGLRHPQLAVARRWRVRNVFFLPRRTALGIVDTVVGLLARRHGIAGTPRCGLINIGLGLRGRLLHAAHSGEQRERAEEDQRAGERMHNELP